ncbi:hypothetical protein ACW9H6_22020 [Pseudomonas sp. SDO528_S397]|uniref:hypothetical protein n=1 Tax=unclassified Pseudomonas TaxID=196821 RepID=UPI0009CDEED6|nr:MULTISPECIES: hypothetical protein [unclassified Pseudomonas]OPK04625.1 hypothetical protein BZ164_09395 [Pseudomonas veronii]
MTDKQTLEAFAKLLEPLAKSLNGIDRSLSLLADLELAKEFQPDPAKRQSHYAEINAAVAADAAAFEALEKARVEREAIDPRGHEQLVKEKGAEEAARILAPVKAALDARGESLKHEQKVRDSFPALDRIHRRRNS